MNTNTNLNELTTNDSLLGKRPILLSGLTPTSSNSTNYSTYIEGKHQPVLIKSYGESDEPIEKAVRKRDVKFYEKLGISKTAPPEEITSLTTGSEALLDARTHQLPPSA